jgi:alginate O-acetyltransferase complex protein AlgI
LLSGLSLILHFGLFNLLAAMWQRVGVNCRTLFRAPLKSRSVSEFWGRRWNLAFSEMTSIAVFRPLSKWWGCGPAVVAGFLFSGMLHELAISLPVRAGFGLPMAYFALHALIVHLEAYLKRRGRPVEGWGWPARIWTAAWLLVPLPLLFHAAFLNELVLPLLGVRGLPIL